MKISAVQLMIELSLATPYFLTMAISKESLMIKQKVVK